MGLGMTLIYGVMKILNIAHGSLYALGAYMSASLIGFYYVTGSYPPMLGYAMLRLAAVVGGLIAGLIIERGVLRFMYGRDEVVMLLSWGLFQKCWASTKVILMKDFLFRMFLQACLLL
jgi:branched-chain amino acid transport system permease protein